MKTIKVKILKCKYNSWWYSDMIGQTVEVAEKSDDRYYRYTDRRSREYISAEDCVEVVDTPRLYNHEDVDYLLPEWANYVTSDGIGKPLFAWENEPERGYYSHGKNDAGFGRTGACMREILDKYVPPLPEGAFIVKV